MKFDIFPAIMAINPFELHKSLLIMEKFNIKCLHADILDGVYTPYISMGQSYFENIAQATKIPIEVHFQVANPIKQINKIKLDLFERVIIHLDSINTDLFKLLPESCKIGIAINPDEPLDKLRKFFNIKNLDKIVVMSSPPGTSDVCHNILDRIYNLKHIVSSNSCLSNIDLQIDGGVRINNIRDFKDRGINQFVCASALFSGDNSIEENYIQLLNLIS